MFFFACYPDSWALETVSAFRWEGIGQPRASGKSLGFPEFPRTSPKVLGDLPGTSLTVDFEGNPEAPRKFVRLLQRSTPLSGSLTPPDGSQKVSPRAKPRKGPGKIGYFERLVNCWSPEPLVQKLTQNKLLNSNALPKGNQIMRLGSLKLPTKDLSHHKPVTSEKIWGLLLHLRVADDGLQVVVSKRWFEFCEKISNSTALVWCHVKNILTFFAWASVGVFSITITA